MLSLFPRRDFRLLMTKATPNRILQSYPLMLFKTLCCDRFSEDAPVQMNEVQRRTERSKGTRDTNITYLGENLQSTNRQCAGKDIQL